MSTLAERDLSKFETNVRVAYVSVKFINFMSTNTWHDYNSMVKILDIGIYSTYFFFVIGLRHRLKRYV